MLPTLGSSEVVDPPSTGNVDVPPSNGNEDGVKSTGNTICRRVDNKLISGGNTLHSSVKSSINATTAEIKGASPNRPPLSRLSNWSVPDGSDGRHR